MDDILVLGKEIFSNHIKQPRVIFGRLCTVGLKGNYTKCSFGLKCIPSLFYVINQYGIKPDPKKVQGIMDIRRPTTITEL